MKESVVHCEAVEVEKKSPAGNRPSPSDFQKPGKEALKFPRRLQKKREEKWLKRRGEKQQESAAGNSIALKSLSNVCPIQEQVDEECI